MAHWQRFKGKVQPGHQVASRAGTEYPEGTVVLQAPFFAARGLDLSPYFLGTLNISIGNYEITPAKPRHRFDAVRWTDLHPPENFSFSHCRLHFEGQCYEGLIYYAHPETKVRHYQRIGVVEVLAPRIAGIGYGSEVEVEINTDEFQVREAGSSPNFSQA